MAGKVAKVRTLVWAGSFAFVQAMASVAFGQGMIGTDSTIAPLVPGARSAPAPGWVRPGTQLTYYGGAAIIPDGYHSYFRDPRGGWIDEGGNRYRQEDATGHGACGHAQVNVVALDATTAVLDIRNYSLRPVALGKVGACVGPAGAPGDWWVNPHVLRRVADHGYRRFRVIRCTFPLGSQTQAIRFHYESRSTRYTQVYDLATGVLLHSSVGTRASFDQSGRGGQMIAHCTLVRTRQLNIPWAGYAAPAWAGRVQSLTYRGTLSPVVYRGSAQQFPGGGVMQIAGRGNGWVKYAGQFGFQRIQGMPPARFGLSAVSGTAQFGGLWIPPRAMGMLRTGQVLDRDPTTGIVTQVTSTGNGVVISQISRGQRIDYGYDRRTGMMVYYGRADSQSALCSIRTVLKLTNVS